MNQRSQKKPSFGDPASLRISLFHVPDCPLVARLKDEVQTALEQVGLTATIKEVKGAYSSPTLLINGREIDGYPLETEPSCRTALPSHDEIVSALRAS